MRLIDVSALKEWVENWYAKNRLYHPYAKNNNIPIPELYDILEQMPSAQPEADLVVVRCKDCKYNSCSPDHGNACCDMFYGMTDQMGYCHYGERRTE